MLTALKIIAACAALPAAAIAYSFFERRAQRRDWDDATRRAAEIMAIGRARREHQANETGNLGKGLPNDPDNVPENQNTGLLVTVRTLDGTRLWERHPDGGMTSTSYREDGTLASIISALEEALRQARGELGGYSLIEQRRYSASELSSLPFSSEQPTSPGTAQVSEPAEAPLPASREVLPASSHAPAATCRLSRQPRRSNNRPVGKA